MKKLIEVALPLDAINKASAREKSIRHGHPSTLHLWWARRPLATARAVLFASLVDDPAEHPEKFKTPEAQQIERDRLFKILENLVRWENSNKPEIFSAALAEIKNSCGDNLPAVFDPFAGGGTIPLEAQRLGLKAFASDLNPVAVMINKAMIEIPAKFKNQPPINPDAKISTLNSDAWHGATGLADDILYYGKLLKQRAFEKIGNLYPTIEGKTVIAWLWARTCTCSNPACGHKMPLVHSFKLSTKQNIFVEPVIDGDKINFTIKHGKPTVEGTVNRNGAHCLFCKSTVPLEHVRNEGKKGNLSAQLMAIVAEGDGGRLYLAPNALHEQIADIKKPDDFPDTELSYYPGYINTKAYGFENVADLFTNRQLTTLTTLIDLISEIQSQVQADGGTKDYSDAIAVYLTFLVDKLADYHSTVCDWHNSREQIGHTFSRSALPFKWDFTEANPFSNSSGCFDSMLNWIYKSVKELSVKIEGDVQKHSATEKFNFNEKVMISTDPPYYSNVPYADVSDFFYVWMRRPLKKIYPQIFGRMSAPKDEELVANPYRHNGSTEAAKNFFEDGMLQALKNIYEISREDFPTTIYYAFKQQESDSASSGWETILNALIRAGFQITATLPMRTELQNRILAKESNALASSIVLACRKRPAENKLLDKGEFLRTLKAELQAALAKMQKATIAPVDMAQAAIGPGIAVYSRFEKVADMNDNEVTVREALKIINAEVAAYLGTQTGNLDAASQFCVDLFTQSGFNEITFGEADVLARAKNISVDKVEESGAVISARGRVRLRDRDELGLMDANRQLKKAVAEKVLASNCAWFLVQNMLLAFSVNGINGAAEFLAKYEGNLEELKNLAYRLYDICEKKNWSKEGTGYNDMVVEWDSILLKRLEYTQAKTTKAEQIEMF